MKCMRWNRTLAAAGMLACVPLVLRGPVKENGLSTRQSMRWEPCMRLPRTTNRRSTLSQAIDKAFAEIVRLDGMLSNYKPESDLSRLNREGHFHAVKVPADLYRVIEESDKYSKLSGGKYDITVAPLVDMWKAALRATAC